MDYTRLMAALRRRRFLILAGVLGCTALTAFGSARLPREYLASATLMPQEQALDSIRQLTVPAEAGPEREELTGRQDRIKTIATVLTSPAVLGPVIKRLRLPTNPTKLQEDLEVKEVTSQIVRVSIKDTDPARAEATVNGIAGTFVEFFTDLRSREARKQLEAAQQERGSADAEVRQASRRLQEFKQRGNISSLPEQTKASLDRATQLEEARNNAEARLREVTAQFASVSATLTRTPRNREIRESATQTALLDRLRLDVSELKRSLDRELTVHTEEHATVKRLRGELTETERRLETESARMQTTVRILPNSDHEALSVRLRDLRGERDGLAARVASLNVDVARLQNQVTAYSGKDVQLALLTQRYTLAEQRMAVADARLGQLRGATSLVANGQPIAIVDSSGPLNPPQDLSQGRTLRLSVLAFVMSLAMCAALAIGLELADRRVKTVEDAERLMELPVVSVVPQLPGRNSEGTLCLTTDNNPDSHMAESYHFLANHILRQTLRRESTVLMAATARPGQGATTALCNLAVALARAGRQVVLVDADLRRPSLHRIFLTDHNAGLTDALRDNITVREALVQTHVENLRLLQAGTSDRDPWSLLWQPSMARVVETLRDSADYVLFNVPSATVFADALCVAPHLDGAVIVLRTSEMPTGAERKVREWLDEVDVPVMGLVLNGVPAREMESYEFHRSYTARRAVPGLVPALAAPGRPPVRRAA